MKAKKTIAVLFALILAFSTCLMLVFAKAGNTTISVGSVEANPGDTVEVDITIDNNPGILGAVLSVSYDSGLTLINSQSGEAFSELSMTRPGAYSSPCNFTWDGIEINSSNVHDGTILKLIFEINSNANPGDIYNISVSSDYGDIVDSDLNAVSVDFNAGRITIDSQNNNNNNYDGTTFCVGSASGEPGSTVNVDVTVANNPGILGAILSISYDGDLTLTNATSGSAFSALSMTRPGAYTSPCNFTWDGVELDPGDIQDGTVLTLTFQIPSDANNGDVYNVYVTSQEGDIVDADLNTVSADYIGGQISVASSTPVIDYPLLAVESVQGEPGSSVDVNVLITNNPGILGAVFTISYDQGLTLTNATSGSAFSALSMTRPGSYSSPCNFTWDGIDINPEDIKDGIVLTLTFSITSNASAGDVYNINIDSNEGDIVDANLNPVDIQFNSGSVTISHSHTYSQNVVAPTCIDKGYTQYTCTICGNSYKTNYVDEISHYYQYTGNRQDYIMTYECVDCGTELSIKADEVFAKWDSYYLNVRPSRVNNRMKTDDSSLLNVVPDSLVDDGIINGKDYALLMRLARQHNDN